MVLYVITPYIRMLDSDWLIAVKKWLKSAYKWLHNKFLEKCGFICNYTLYKNTGFWLVNSRDIFLQIQALHCEFVEFFLHVGAFA